MYLSSNLISILLILLLNLHFSSSICSEYYSSQTDQQPCECEDYSNNGQSYISLKCIGYSNIQNLKSNINYRTVEYEFCSEDLNFDNKPFNDLTINILRIRHCNLINLNDQSFQNLKQFEKFYLENSTIKSLSTSDGNFQDIFSSNSFQILKSLTLKTVHYHQTEQHDKKLNLEFLLQQLPNLYRLELTNIHLDNYRYYDIQLVERLLLRHLPEIFHTQPLISSLRKLEKLKYILFEHDQLKSIEDLQSNTIDDIDLSSNLIQSIDEYTFEHVPKLRQLTLTANPLNSIDKNAFCGIENLQRLSIHIKHTQISPLDNCILLNYPNLQINQDSQTKFQCNCELMNIFHLKRQQSNDINRIFKVNQICLLKNDTNKSPGLQLYELENYFNCSSVNQCNRLCQDRKIKSLPIIKSSYDQVNLKYSSLSTPLYSFFSYSFFLLLLGFLYL
jgi:hypothetical protein